MKSRTFLWYGFCFAFYAFFASSAALRENRF
jgi:hypothetical protein